MNGISIVIPAKNEQAGLSLLLPKLKTLFPKEEIIVVNDGSTDGTEEVIRENGAISVSHPVSMGNGAAIKTGFRRATGDIVCFMDADGQHQPEDIGRLLHRLDEGYDMVIGARSKKGQANMMRGIGNGFYNWFASLMVGHKVHDLTSGFRLVRAKKFREFLSLLPNKFSYPTTITMSFFRAGYPVAYEPIVAPKRIGKSHLNIWKDGIRFLIIIFKVATLYSPLKIFMPMALLQFLIGSGYYLYTYLEFHRFTNMSALLFTSAVTVFLMGLVSEQITALMFKSKD